MMSFINVGIAFALLLGCAFLSYLQNQKLEKDMLLASVRALFQLALLGHILAWIFLHASAYLCLSAALIMTVNSAIHSTSRVKAKYPGLFLDNLLSTAVAIWPLAFIGSYLFEAKVWWQVEIFLPLVGMMLGNTLNGLSMGIDHFTHDVREKKEEVLSWIALGGTTQEATANLFRKSLKISLTPTINSMLSMGVVSIPGTMTGQILGGSTPIEAAKSQMILMLLITCGTYLGTFTGLVLSRKKLFNTMGQPCF